MDTKKKEHWSDRKLTKQLTVGEACALGVGTLLVVGFILKLLLAGNGS